MAAKWKRDSVAVLGARASYENARLTREVAEIALAEYVQAIYEQDRETILGEIALARSDRERAEDRLEWTERMLDKGHVVLVDYTSAKLSVDRAAFVEEQACTKLDVLDRYTYEKTLKELTSEVEKARAEELAKKATHQRLVADEWGWLGWFMTPW
jgi:hypothetical protein